jgi:glucose/arabinose dehydrogenase
LLNRKQNIVKKLKSKLFIRVILLPIIIAVAIIFVIFLYRDNTADQLPLIRSPYNKTLNVQLVAEGLSFPTSMEFIDDKKLLVSEKDKGTIRLVSLDDGSLTEKPLMKVNVEAEGERGLLGIAAITKSNTSTYNKDVISNNDTDVFVYYSDTEVPRNRIYKYQWDGHALIKPQLILDLPTEPGPYHQGGKLKVSPDNKFLYAVIGDLNAPNSRLQNFEDKEELNDTSVILKINLENNNTLSSLGNNRTEVTFCPSSYNTRADEKPSKRNYCYYAYGIRNSFGLAFNPITGQLWDTENGEDSYDEINLVEPGFNSGWAQLMGPYDRNINATVQVSLVNFTGSHYADPVFSWKVPIGVTDIEFLNSTNLGSKYRNNIFVGDINNGNLYYFEVNGNRSGLTFDPTLYSSADKLTDFVADNTNESSAVTFGTNFGRITDIETGPDGFLYILSYGEGKIYRLVPS